MEKKYKISIIILIIFLISALMFFIFSNIQNMDYKNGIDRSLPIKGTYILKGLDNNNTYISIDYGEGINEFYHFKNDNKIINSGQVKKNEDNYYVLYDKTNKIYGKVIPNYKKIYFIDNNLNIQEFSYYPDSLIYPAEIKK